MSYKKWILITLILCIVMATIFMITNYFIDFYKYFNPKEENALPFENLEKLRITKIKHISQNPYKYYGYILGGSKSGAIDADLLSKYENGKFYNLCVPIGTFLDYKEFTKFIVENTSAKKIVLHLGNIELLKNGVAKMPYLITGRRQDKYSEIFNMLFVNPNQMITDYKNNYTFKNGGIDYKRYYSLVQKLGYKEYNRQFVIPQNYKYLEWRTFNIEQKNIPFFSDNLLLLSQIVDLCRMHDVELKIIIGPTFLCELEQYEGDAFYEYLRGIASISDFWDFSGFTYVSFNPCNFVNDSHYTPEVAKKMINIVYGKEENDGMGTYVTPDNFDEYINNRREKFAEIKKIYEKDEEIKLDNEKSSSFIN